MVRRGQAASRLGGLREARDRRRAATAREWLREVLATEPPATTITAYWFGIFNPHDDDDNVGADVYVSGSARFAGDINGEDWNVSPAYWPEGRYADSRVLRALYRRAYRGKRSLENDAEYPLALGYAAFAVAHLCRVIPPRLLLGSASERAVIVGFDDGDMVELGIVRADGLVLAPTNARA